MPVNQLMRINAVQVIQMVEALVGNEKFAQAVG